jgi:anti-anti-sigma regulatory factor
MGFRNTIATLVARFGPNRPIPVEQSAAKSTTILRLEWDLTLNDTTRLQSQEMRDAIAGASCVVIDLRQFDVISYVEAAALKELCAELNRQGAAPPVLLATPQTKAVLHILGILSSFSLNAPPPPQTTNAHRAFAELTSAPQEQAVVPAADRVSFVM